MFIIRLFLGGCISCCWHFRAGGNCSGTDGDKEAVAKALGAPAGLSWQDCEILIGERGKPYLELSGTVAAEAKRQGITNWHLSLSHDGNIATAFVIAEKQ